MPGARKPTPKLPRPSPDMMTSSHPEHIDAIAEESLYDQLVEFGPFTEQEDQTLEANDPVYAATKRMIADKLAADDALEAHYDQLTRASQEASTSRSRYSHASHRASLHQARESQGSRPSQARSSGTKPLLGAQGRDSQGSRPSQARSSGTKPLAGAHFAVPEDGQTSRGLIESRSEKKFMKMMNQVPDESDCNTEQPGICITRFDYSDACRSNDEPPKSPRKKFLGMKIPYFKSFSNLSNASRAPPVHKLPPMPSMAPLAPMPPMPPKAAQVLGSSPPKLRRTQRSETTKSLPSRTHHSIHTKPYASAGHRHPNSTPVPPRSSKRSSSQSQSPVDFHEAARKIGQVFADGADSPPIPPKKDTPPVAHVERKKTSQPADGQTEVSGISRSVDPIKYNPVSADEYRALIGDTKEAVPPVMANPSPEDIAFAQVERNRQNLENLLVERARIQQLRDDALNAERARAPVPAHRVSELDLNVPDLHSGSTLGDDFWNTYSQPAHPDVSIDPNPTLPPMPAPHEDGQNFAASDGSGMNDETPFEQASRPASDHHELEPRFFNPANSPVNFGSPGERPSQNLDQHHFVYGLPPAPLRYFAPPSNSTRSGSNYPIVFEGRRSEIEYESPTARHIQTMDASRQQRIGRFDPDPHTDPFNMNPPTTSSAVNQTQGSAPLMQQRVEATFSQASAFDMVPMDQPETAPGVPTGTPLHLNPARNLRLTTLLHDFTPSRANFTDGFNPEVASAVPSPLYAHPSQHTRSRDQLPEPAAQITSYNRTGRSTGSQMHYSADQSSNMDEDKKASINEQTMLSDGRTMYDHFMATNDHMEDGFLQLNHLMEKHEGEVMEAVGAKHAETIALLKQYAEENKTHFHSLEELVNHVSNEGAVAAQKIRDLMAFIKTDLFEIVKAQKKKTAALESEVHELRQIVYTLHNFVLGKSGKARSPTKLSKSPGVPSNLSEPSPTGPWADNTMPTGAPSQKSADREKPKDGRAPHNYFARGQSHGGSQSGNAVPASGAQFGSVSTGYERGDYRKYYDRSRSHSPAKRDVSNDGQFK